MNSEARVLDQRSARSKPHRGHSGSGNQGTYADKASAGSGARGAQDGKARQVREWLLLLLRFAVTLDPVDQSAALASADEIDALGVEWRPSGPTFFRRTTQEVCTAIAALDDPKRTAVLNRHIARIDNPALRRAFQAAVNLEDRRSWPKRKEQTLWAGLR